MGKTFQIGAGNKVKLFVALLPLGDRTEPEDVSITAASGITSAATSVTVTVLTGAIAKRIATERKKPGITLVLSIFTFWYMVFFFCDRVFAPHEAHRNPKIFTSRFVPQKKSIAIVLCHASAR